MFSRAGARNWGPRAPMGSIPQVSVLRGPTHPLPRVRYLSRLLEDKVRECGNSTAIIYKEVRVVAKYATDDQRHFRSVLFKPQITLNDLARGLRLGKWRSEMLLAIRAGSVARTSGKKI
ncbi:hypothetical protein J6590_055648 [Homalodisca vitripennis]|nr:hypothetical protein J6590_055648 [Homalodisca vitripennis]